MLHIKCYPPAFSILVRSYKDKNNFICNAANYIRENNILYESSKLVKKLKLFSVLTGKEGPVPHDLCARNSSYATVVVSESGHKRTILHLPVGTGFVAVDNAESVVDLVQNNKKLK